MQLLGAVTAITIDPLREIQLAPLPAGFLITRRSGCTGA
jgi:hypothetical protein